MLNKNSRVIVTGATSGIGLSLVSLLSSIEVKLAICGRDESKMKALLGKPEISQQIAHFDCFCVTSEHKIVRFVSDAIRELEWVDILVNCAGANTSRAQLSE